MNKVIGILILCTLGLAIVGGLADAGDSFYSFVGVALFVVGTWGGILLIKKQI